jgi:release factor glutamine methyltransferase
MAEGSQVPSPDELSAWASMLDGLIAGRPIQYLTGETQFMDLLIACDERALIPRPETEQLVEWVLNDSSLWTHPEPQIADIGTGTGCIALALAYYRPQAALQATDCSSEALALARENGQTLGLGDRIQWQCCHLTDGLKNSRLHAIVSNPPYIEESAWEGLEVSVRDREPKGALTSGVDGLDCIRRLIDVAPAHLLPRGSLFMEIGENQKELISTMLTENNYQNISFRADLAGRVRMVRAEVSP